MYKKLKTLLIHTGIRAVTLDYYLVKKIIKRWVGRYNKILDVGCGIGHLTPLFSKQKYLGVDLDSTSLELAKRLHPGYKFQQKNIVSFRTKRMFDSLLVVGVLHHLDDNDFKRGLSVMGRILKKGGRAIIIEAIPPISKFNIAGKIFRFFDQGKYIRKHEAYAKIMRKKFKIIHSRKYHGGLVDYGVLIIENNHS